MTGDATAKAEVSSTDPEALEGVVIDERYRLKRFISQGGMGSVYEAEHVTIQKPIAVKVLHAAMAQVPELVRRFEREAFAIGRIDHPNCIRVSDFGKLDDGSLFLVMEFADGHTLADRIDDGGPLETGAALRVTRHILRGLAHIHRADIVHRDIKPENILLAERDGDREFAKILDFGIAKLVGEAKRPDDHNLTQAGMAFGTPTYMSPEQTLGDKVDARADLYQVGLLLYEMLAGEPPFSADDKIELMAMHTSRPPPPIAEYNPAARIDDAVQKLLDRSLAKRASERFQSADEFIEAVDHAIESLGVRPPARFDTPLPFAGGANQRPTGSSETQRHTLPPTTTQALPAPSRRNLEFLLAGGVGIILVGILAAVFFASGDEGASNAETADPRSDVARRAAAELELGRPEAAIALLKAPGVTLDGDADALLLLGHAHAARNRAKEAMAAYRKAIAADHSVQRDAAMRANLSVLFNDKRSFPEAAKMLMQDLREDSAKDKIKKRAVTKGDGAWRHLALQTAEELGFADELDLRRLYELDLVEGSRCKHRRAAVAKLRALGDPAAIPALTAARERRGTRGRWRGRRINGCLKDDATKAIQYLGSLAEEKAGEAKP